MTAPEEQRFGTAVDLAMAGDQTELVDVLRQQLGDPSLDIVYWRPANGH